MEPVKEQRGSATRRSPLLIGVEARLRLLLEAVVNGTRPWKDMEEMTGVKAEKWRHFSAGLTGPSVELLVALSTAFPEYAFWLSTGLTSYEGRHGVPEATAQPLRVVLPAELAEMVKSKMISGHYTSENAVILDGLRALLDQDRGLGA